MQPESGPGQHLQAEGRDIHILLVEDSPGDARLVQEMIREAAPPEWRLHHVETLAAALSVLQQDGAEAILLDLNLPDSSGVSTVEKVVAASQGVAVVVLTGQEDEDVGLATLNMFAQDYLPKSDLNSSLLVRSLRYAMERARLLVRLDEANERGRRERELRNMERLVHDSGQATGVTASLYGRLPLRKHSSPLFEELMAEYRELLERNLNEQLYREEQSSKVTVQGFAARLGFLNAGPQDVIDIHVETLKELTGSPRHQAYVDEGRMLLLALMGRLASYYRCYAQGRGRM